MASSSLFLRKESRCRPLSLHEKMKIGILDQTCAGWSGGASYTRILLASLAATRANGSADADPASLPHENRLVFLAREGKIGPPDRVQSASFASVLQAYITSGRVSEFGFDVVLPVRDNAVHDIPTAKVGWIPDFQHYRLPELFSLKDLAARDALFDTIARDCELVIVSSESAREDFETFLPLFTEKARVLPFPSILWAASLTDDPQRVVLNYHLPAKYGFVANQFWRHKNHSVLPDALSILKRQGIELPLVLTGLADRLSRYRESTPLGILPGVRSSRCRESGAFPRASTLLGHDLAHALRRRGHSTFSLRRLEYQRGGCQGARPASPLFRYSRPPGSSPRSTRLFRSHLLGTARSPSERILSGFGSRAVAAFRSERAGAKQGASPRVRTFTPFDRARGLFS